MDPTQKLSLAYGEEFDFVDFDQSSYSAATVDPDLYAYSLALPPTASLLFSSDNVFADALLSSPLGLDFDTPFTSAYSSFSPSSERSYSGLGTPELTELPALFGDDFQLSQWTESYGQLPALPPLEIEVDEHLKHVKVEAAISPELTRLPSIEVEDFASMEIETVGTEAVADEKKPRVKRDKSEGKFTGTRNSKIPHIPVDAPTMSRSYIIPSSTSRKRSAPTASPAPPTKKSSRARRTSPSPTAAYENPEEPYDPSMLPSAVLSAIEIKRRSNTLAARLSRNRKAEHLKELMEELEKVKAERDEWIEKAGDFEKEVLALRA